VKTLVSIDNILLQKYFEQIDNKIIINIQVYKNYLYQKASMDINFRKNIDIKIKLLKFIPKLKLSFSSSAFCASTLPQHFLFLSALHPLLLCFSHEL